MTDKPIIFSAPMVRGLLDGRKTQTRRVLKPWPGMQAGWLTMEPLHSAPSGYLCEVNGRLGVQMQHPLAGTQQPYGEVDAMSPLGWVRLPYAPGDRLYVREAFCPRLGYPAAIAKPHYRADDDKPEWRGLWKPSIHMPRWASRLTLTVTEVRVQRVQEISEADAMAEGIAEVSSAWQDADEPATYPSFQAYGQDACFCGSGAARLSYMTLWNSLHGPGAWGANPWVVAVSFTVQHGNIDLVKS